MVDKLRLSTVSLLEVHHLIPTFLNEIIPEFLSTFTSRPLTFHSLDFRCSTYSLQKTSDGRYKSLFLEPNAHKSRWSLDDTTPQSALPIHLTWDLG